MSKVPWPIYEPMMEKRILDLEQCLAGNSNSERWKELNIELANLKGELSAQREYNSKHEPPKSPAP